MKDKCPFLVLNDGFWGPTYRCEKTKENVLTGSSLYENYCRWSSKHKECPHFKPVDSGGCYITSACTEAKGFADDCEELMILRDYRDHWLSSQPTGEEDIQTYYQIAPRIVKAIRETNAPVEVFSVIYDELVLPCVELIKRGSNIEAYSLYKSYTEKLECKYLHQNI